MIKIVRTKISFYLPYGGQAVLICVLNFAFLSLDRWQDDKKCTEICIYLKRVSPFAKWVSGRIEKRQARIRHLEARDETRRRSDGKQWLRAKTTAPINKSLNPNRSTPAASMSQMNRHRGNAKETRGVEFGWRKPMPRVIRQSGHGVLLARGFFGLGHTHWFLDRKA
jgi:hypothetical protein